MRSCSPNAARHRRVYIAPESADLTSARTCRRLAGRPARGPISANYSKAIYYYLSILRHSCLIIITFGPVDAGSPRQTPFVFISISPQVGRLTAPPTARNELHLCAGPSGGAQPDKWQLDLALYLLLDTTR